jgi:hypothetical protein
MTKLPNGQNLRQYFKTRSAAFDYWSAARKLGFDVDYEPFGITLNVTAESALATLQLWSR